MSAQLADKLQRGHRLSVPAAAGILDAQTLHEMFQARVRSSAAQDAYRQYDVPTNAWIAYSWEEIATRVSLWRAAYRRESLPRGARVAILLPNGVDHVCGDLGALFEGLVPVPLHVVDNAENLAYVIADAGASILLVDSIARWASLQPYCDRLPELMRVVCLGPEVPAAEDSIAASASAWLSAGESHPSAEGDPPGSTGNPDDLAAIVYTSGTTGRPKGVMLSHRNVLANVRSIMSAIRVLDCDVFLSFLPLSHTLERTVGYYLPMVAGALVAYARSIPLLMEDMVGIRPTVLVSVPRIYERAHAALQEMAGHSIFKRWLLAVATDVGWQRFCYSQGRAARPSPGARLLFPLLDRLVGKPVRARFGGRLRAAVTGGAPMALEVARPFLALGVPLLQGYGMTESSPVIACNAPEDNDPQSVGRALPGVYVRIGADQELLTRSESVMRGYWKRPEDTRRVLEAEGWLHTGDQARIEGNRIFIQGRLKDIIVTSTGEKIAPADLETALTGDPFFEQALVLGERRPYLVVLLVLNRGRWRQHAQGLGVDPDDPAQLRSPQVLQWAIGRVESALKGFPSYATPRTVLLTAEPWTVSAGLVTPTLKPKRAAIETRYATQIAELYRGH